jgi:hypothetical protein
MDYNSNNNREDRSAFKNLLLEFIPTRLYSHYVDHLMYSLGVDTKDLGETKPRFEFMLPNKKKYGHYNHVNNRIGINPFRKNSIVGHEGGHFILYNVAAEGDKERRKEFYSNLFGDIPYILIARKIKEFEAIHGHNPELRSRMSDLTVLETEDFDNSDFIYRGDKLYSGLVATVIGTIINESFARYCANVLMDSIEDFDYIQHTGLEAKSESNHFFKEIFQDPDEPIKALEEFVLLVITHILEEEDIIDYGNIEIDANQLTRPLNKLLFSVKEKIDGLSNLFSDTIGYLMYLEGKDKGFSTVAHEILGIKEFNHLSDESRIQSSVYDREKHLEYLVKRFVKE